MIGLDQFSKECWETESLRLCVPSDVDGRFSVCDAWFGLAGDSGVNGSSSVAGHIASAIASESSIVVKAQAQNLGLDCDACVRKVNLRTLHVKCSFQWLNENEQAALASLRETLHTPLDLVGTTEDQAAFEKMCTWWVEHIPQVGSSEVRNFSANGDSDRKFSKIVRALDVLKTDALGRAAFNVLRYLISSRRRYAVKFGIASEEFGYPLVSVALHAVRMVLALMHMLSPGDCSLYNTTFRHAPRVVVQRFARECVSGNPFDSLTADLLARAYDLWQTDSVGSGLVETAGFMLVVQRARDSLLEELATDALDVPTSLQDFGSLYNLVNLGTSEPIYMHADTFELAVNLSFCPICLKPLQQFPENIGAAVDAHGCRFEAALYHKHCVASGEPFLHGLAILSSTTDAFASRSTDLPAFLLKAESQAKGWLPLPCLSRVQAWTKFVKARYPNSPVVPCSAVALVLAATLPVHPANLEIRLNQRFGRKSCISVDDLPTVASWAIENQCDLVDNCWSRPNAQLLSTPVAWTLWFQGWDYGLVGSLNRATIALGLAVAVREMADAKGYDRTKAALIAFRKGMTDMVKLVWPGCLGIYDSCDDICVGRFLREIAPAAEAVLQRLQAASLDKIPASPGSTRPASPAPMPPHLEADIDTTASEKPRRERTDPTTTDISRTRVRAATVDASDLPSLSASAMRGTSTGTGASEAEVLEDISGTCFAKILWLSGKHRIISLRLDSSLADLHKVFDLLALDSLGSFRLSSHTDGHLQKENQKIDERRLFVAGRKLARDPNTILRDVGIVADCTILSYCNETSGSCRCSTSELSLTQLFPSSSGIQPFMWAGALAILGISFYLPCANFSFRFL